MIDQAMLSDLKALLGEFPSSTWLCHDKRIDDDTQKWVIYQAGFDSASDRRLELITKAINLLPDLIAATEHSLAAAQEDPVALLQAMIEKAILQHEKNKH